MCNFHLLGKTLWQSKKNQLYASLWAGCDELRGGMDASLYKELCAYAIVFKICF
ncbi:restriction endonuclease subunit M [Neisseria meningitidis]|nr:restriction endonuclease subunit M [Neisseria meningitidis]OFQ09406.1 restriction endonuclease subunit M [Neisseria sp. HMSC070F02]MBQ5162575.1 restriction endonuclease subunit M [Neisseria meningitidis]MBQ5201512.1 restriction endonuclease subunit M [Neisseria meningitidis]MBR7217760.1 restriction endonuclease subunit M [Neisseria meningitidis]